MGADRKKLEAGRDRARESLSDPDPAVREPAKWALDHADVALGMMDHITPSPTSPSRP